MKPLLYSISNKGDVTETLSQNRTLLYFFSAVALLIIVIGGRKLYFNKKKNQIETVVKVTSEKDSVVKTNPYNHLISFVLNNDSSFYLTFLEAFPGFSEKLLSINALWNYPVKTDK